MAEFPGAFSAAALKFEFPCELSRVRDAARKLHDFLAERDCREEILAACELAFVEACNNAIKYAPASTRALPVAVEAGCSPADVEIRVTDHTNGFDWPERVELPEPESESGRGLYLIQSLMDNAVYLRGGDENVLVMRKSRSSPRAGGDGFPQLPGFDFAAFCRSADDVSGDFYDVLPAGEGAVLLVIADVMGKGALAATFAEILRTLLRMTPGLTRQPGVLLTRVNQLLFGGLSEADMFITVQLAFVDTSARNLVVASAGHCPLLIADEREVKSFSPEGIPIGIVPDAHFATETVELTDGCRVMLYTDGLIEAANAQGEHYGQERLAVWWGNSGKATASSLKHKLATELVLFQIKTRLNDDQTFLMMTGKSSPHDQTNPGS
jgi:anti-sigma regulatory factor (Ser/Thr protein kinase)